MGNKEVVPASHQEINEYFEQECFTIGGNCNIEKLQSMMSNLSIYVGVQRQLEELWEKKKGKLSDIFQKGTHFCRKGIPDSKRRQAFLDHFELEPK